ncbi:hypothetical protein CLAIMM_00214 [Cladophialophora immunda]|nr:hypothetical protein CLAIMM_00214 [Cladophialophora immunda]
MLQARDRPPVEEAIHSLPHDASTVTTPPTTTTATTTASNRPRHHHDGQPRAPVPHGVEITTRADLSLLYRVLRAVIKPLRPRLVRPRDPAQPAGSPRLSPPKKRNVEIAETRCEGVWMYRVRATGGKGKGGVERAGGPRGDGMSAAGGGGFGNLASGVVSDGSTGHHGQAVNPRGCGRRHRVYYFCGGGFQTPPAPEHWRFLALLTQDLANRRLHPPAAENSPRADILRRDMDIELVLVSYPLAPNSPARESLRVLKQWLTKVLDEAVENGDTLSLMGDSSGGNVVLSLGFWAVQNYALTPQQQQQQQQVSPRADPSLADDGTMRPPNGTPRTSPRFPLTSLISISAPTDLTNSNPQIREADKLDCVLTAALTREVAEVWTGNRNSDGNGHGPKNQDPSSYGAIPLADSSVSPLRNPEAAFHALKDRQVNVHGVLGTHDVLAPDGIEFMRKCQRLGVTGKWLVWEGQMHCFPLAGGGGVIGIREGREGRGFVVDLLRRDCEREGQMMY